MVLNLQAGQLSLFVSPELGAIVAAKATVSGGITLLKNAPTNNSLRGTFMAVGLIAAYKAGVTGEYFWSSPLPNNFNPANGPNGIFGGGVFGVGAGVSGSISYGLEFLVVDVNGDHLFPFVPDPITIYVDVAKAVNHDIFNHPIFPWSPYR